jgi:hypothetical protein
MREKAWRVAAAALLMGFAIGVPGGEQAAADQDSALFEDGPVRRDPPLRV